MLESDSSDIDLDEDSELDSDWEYESGEEEQYEPSHENLDEADEAVEDSETEGEAVAAESNRESEEERDIERNEVSAVEPVSSSSSEDEPLARLVQHAPPNKLARTRGGGRYRGRQGRSIPRGLQRTRGGRRMSVEGQDLPVQGRQRAGGRIVGRARARGERGHGGGRRGGRRGRGQRGQAIDDNDEMEDPEGDLEWTNIDIEEEATENDSILQAALNAHKNFIEITPKAQDKKISFIDFLFRCIKQIVTAPKDQIAPRNDELSRLTGRHFNVLIPCKEGAKNAKKRCRVCYARKIKTVSGGDCRTVYHCEDCPSLPGLHTGKCFKIYHTLKDHSTLE